MKSWMRQHRYALGVTLRRLATQPFSSLANVAVITLALAIPLLGASILLSVQPIAGNLSTSPQISVFLEPAAPHNAARELATRIAEEHSGDVRDSRVVSREQALQHLQKNPAWSDALAVLPENPLPDIVIVTLTGNDFAERATQLAATWRTWKHVDNVQLDSEWVQRLQALLHFARIGLMFLAIGVAVVVLATVFNTVRMQAMAQREEITVVRLVGATETFVRRPFLYLGALTGVVSGLLSIVVCALGLSLLNQAVQGLARSYGVNFSLGLPDFLSLLLFVVGVAILGAFSARWSVTRNTRF